MHLGLTVWLQVCCILVCLLLLPFSLGALAVEALRTSSVEATTSGYKPKSREEAKTRRKMARAQYKLYMLSLQQTRAARLHEVACEQDTGCGPLIVAWVFWCAFLACICICKFLVCVLCLLTMRVQMWTNLLLFCFDLTVGVVDSIAFAQAGLDCVHCSAEGRLGLNVGRGPADLKHNIPDSTAEGGLALWESDSAGVASSSAESAEILRHCFKPLGGALPGGMKRPAAASNKKHEDDEAFAH